MNNNNFPTNNSFPNPGGCGTGQNVPYYNTYSPAFACPGENQGVNSVAATSRPMIFGLTSPAASWAIVTSTAIQYIYFSGHEATGVCADLTLADLPDGATLTLSDTLTSNSAADRTECIWDSRLTVGQLLISPADTTVTQLNGIQTFPTIANACSNADVIATCVGSCANQLVASNIAIGAEASFTLIVPANSGAITVQFCAGCMVETPSFTSVGIPQTAQAQAPVASFCPPNGAQF